MTDQHRFSAAIATTQLEVIDSTFTLDDTWSPYGQATLRCVIPADLDSIDPREGLRVELRAEQAFGLPTAAGDYAPGGSIAAWTAAFGGSIPAINAAYFRGFNSSGLRDSTTRRASLSLRKREIDWRDQVVTLELATDEALLQTYALVATEIYKPGITSVRGLVINVLALIGAFLEPGSDDGTIDPDASDWVPGVSAWDYLAPLVQTAGLRLYCDELRRWYLVDDTTIIDGLLQLSDASTITADRDSIDLDGDWYDAVVITYEWIDNLGVTQQAWDTAADTTLPQNVLSVTYKRPYPGPGAAARVLSRALGRGRVQAVRAISDYRATPSQAVSITVAGDDTQVGYLSSVQWAWPAAEMSVSSRGLVEAPVTAWVLDTPGVHWADIPVGIDWTEDI